MFVTGSLLIAVLLFFMIKRILLVFPCFDTNEWKSGVSSCSDHPLACQLALDGIGCLTRGTSNVSLGDSAEYRWLEF